MPGARHGAQGGAWGDAARLVQHAGQRLDGRVLEQAADRDLQPHLAAQARDQPDRQQRMAAKREEAVSHGQGGSGLDGQGQHLGKQRGDGVFTGVAGRGGTCQRCIGGRQGAAVQLAIGQAGQGVQRNEGGGHHMVGQAAGQFLAQPLMIGGLALAPHDIGDDAALAGLILAQDHGVLRPARSGHRGTNFAQFDAQPADLDLLVGATADDQLAILAPHRQIARAIHAFTGGEGIGDKAVRRQARLVQIAARKAAAGDVKLARDAGGNAAQFAVEDMKAGIGDRPADGDGARLIGAVAQMGGHPDRGLGRAIGMVDLAVQPFTRPCQQIGAQGLAATDDPAQGQVAGAGFVDERFQHRGHEMHHRHPAVADQPGQIGGIAVAVGSRDDQPGAADQREQQLPHRHVKAEGGLVQNGVIGLQRIFSLHPAQPVDDAAMWDHHPLGVPVDPEV